MHHKILLIALIIQLNTTAKAIDPQNTQDTPLNQIAQTTNRDSNQIKNTNTTDVQNTSQQLSNDVQTDHDMQAMEFSCEELQPYDTSIFNAQQHNNKVYLTPSVLVSPTYNAMGYTKFIRVFGIPIIATHAVSDDRLMHGASVLASVLDGDQDGKPDSPETLAAMQRLNTTIGYAANAQESEQLWSEKFRSPEAKGFRERFACSIHFFEQWAEDQSPAFHTIRQQIKEEIEKEAGGDKAKYEEIRSKRWGKDSDECHALQVSGFDWPIIYFPFTVAYYGALESIGDETRAKISEYAAKAKDDGIFEGLLDDNDMELADFVVWSYITDKNGLECFCDSEEFDVWRLCTSRQLEEWNSDWVAVLRKLPGLPAELPTNKYDSPAVTEVVDQV